MVTVTPEIQAMIDNAFHAGRAAQRAVDEAAQQERAEELQRLTLSRGVPGWHDARLRALDAAEQAGEAAYAAERARQGLIPYDRHLPYLGEAAA